MEDILLILSGLMLAFMFPTCTCCGSSSCDGTNCATDESITACTECSTAPEYYYFQCLGDVLVLEHTNPLTPCVWISTETQDIGDGDNSWTLDLSGGTGVGEAELVNNTVVFTNDAEFECLCDTPFSLSDAGSLTTEEEAALPSVICVTAIDQDDEFVDCTDCPDQLMWNQWTVELSEDIADAVDSDCDEINSLIADSIVEDGGETGSSGDCERDDIVSDSPHQLILRMLVEDDSGTLKVWFGIQWQQLPGSTDIRSMAWASTETGGEEPNDCLGPFVLGVCDASSLATAKTKLSLFSDYTTAQDVARCDWPDTVTLNPVL